jgi:hypothetical protein
MQFNMVQTLIPGRFLSLIIFVFISSFHCYSQEYYQWLNTNLENLGVSDGAYTIGGISESATLGLLNGSAVKITKMVTGQHFTKSVEINVAKQPVNIWDSNFQLRNKTVLKKGDIVLAVFFMRCNYAADATSSCEASVCFKKHSNNEWLWGKTIKSNAEWRQYFVPFTIDRDYPIDDFRMELISEPNTISGKFLLLLKWLITMVVRQMQPGVLKLINELSNLEKIR